VLITGGAGYIGTELVGRLCGDPRIQEIVVYDNLSRGNHGLFTQGTVAQTAPVRFVHGDVLDSHGLRTVMRDVDAVVHLAAKVSTPYANVDPHSYDQVNHWGTAEVVYAVEESAIDPVIHLSTTSVYGFSETPVTEDTPATSTNAYAVSKIRAESHVRRWIKQGRGRGVILRSGNVFGYNPSMRFDAVINRFVFDAKYTNRIALHGAGTQVRPFIGVGDIASVIRHALLEDMPGGVYNVFSDNLAIRRIAGLLKEVFPDLEVQFLNQHITYGSLRLAPNPVVAGLLTRDAEHVLVQIRDLVDHLTFCRKGGGLRDDAR
jgi:UDP-glucose 4-epimerase